MSRRSHVLLAKLNFVLSHHAIISSRHAGCASGCHAKLCPTIERIGGAYHLAGVVDAVLDRLTVAGVLTIR